MVSTRRNVHTFLVLIFIVFSVKQHPVDQVQLQKQIPRGPILDGWVLHTHAHTHIYIFNVFISLLWGSLK